MNKTKLNQITIDLLKFIRGEKSYGEIDLLLNIGANQYRRWESGKVEIKWDDFVLICKTMNLPLKQALADALGFDGNPFHYHEIIKVCIAGSDQKIIAKNLDVSRFVIHRWLSCKSTPHFYQIFALFYFGSHRIDLFVIKLLGQDKGQLFMKIIPGYDSLDMLLENQPWFISVMCALKMKEYKQLKVHSTQFISEKTKIPEAEIDHCLQLLKKNELIALDNGIYSTDATNITFIPTKTQAKQITMYWLNHNLNAIKKYDELSDIKSYANFLICNLSEKSAIEVKKMHNEFVKKIAFFSSQDQDDSTTIHSLAFSMLNFDDIQKK